MNTTALLWMSGAALVGFPIGCITRTWEGNPSAAELAFVIFPLPLAVALSSFGVAKSILDPLMWIGFLGMFLLLGAMAGYCVKLAVKAGVRAVRDSKRDRHRDAVHARRAVEKRRNKFL
jgi:hypothetical protein